jgi:hypothetical protein
LNDCVDAGDDVTMSVQQEDVDDERDCGSVTGGTEGFKRVLNLIPNNVADEGGAEHGTSCVITNDDDGPTAKVAFC